MAYWQGQKLHQILMSFTENEVWVFLLWNDFHKHEGLKLLSQVMSQRWMDLYGRMWFFISRPIPDPAGKWWHFFFSFLYTWRKWTNYIEYLLGTRHWPWHLADDVSSDTLCCVVVLLPSVSNEETEAKLNARYSRPCSEVCWFRVGSLELGFLNPSTCYATY